MPNDDARSTTARTRSLVITGPNMAGKSTVLRQVALIVLMAQMGSLRAGRGGAQLGLVDRIFTRVGALDNLARGQSHLHGRDDRRPPTSCTTPARAAWSCSTRSAAAPAPSTGCRIAWAVAEHLHDLHGRGVKTLFATHYHELTDLGDRMPRRDRTSTSPCKEWNDEIIFLRQLVPGGTNRSYGIQVARLAGDPGRGDRPRQEDPLRHRERRARFRRRRPRTGGARDPGAARPLPRRRAPGARAAARARHPGHDPARRAELPEPAPGAGGRGRGCSGLIEFIGVT
ncbi:MAG: hypothetical protein MZU95_13510 [Desulfomicrobium escambiense]|nr:hypothetical protein [Desulfomicrobium escambiense]